MGAEESSLQRVVEDGVDQLRAGLTVLTRVALEPKDVPPIKARVDGCVAAFLSLPLPQQAEYKSRATGLEPEIDEVKALLLRADAKVPMGTFRRKIDTASLDADQLVSYARLLATKPFDGGPLQQRFELIVTRALSVEKPGRVLALRPLAERDAILDRILVGHVGDPARREEATKFFADAKARLSEFADAGQLFEANFDREARAFESELGDGLLDREVLSALVEFEVAFNARRLAIPASAHPMSLAPGPAGPSRRAPRRPPLLSRPAPPPVPGGVPADLASLIDESVAEVGDAAAAGEAAIELASEDSGDGTAPAKESSPAELAAVLFDEAEDRVRAIADLLDVGQALGVDASHLELVRSTLDLCKKNLDALGEPGSEGYERRLRTYEESVSVGEETALEIDALIDMRSTKEWFEEAPRSPELLQRYARLLGGARRLRDVQLDRLEFLVTRLLSTDAGNERKQMASRAEAAPILEYVLVERPHVEAHERASAVTFFRDATLQLATLHSLEEVFDGGFYLDVRGYKVALRDQLRDPDVLYAAIALNVAIHNRLEEMRELELRSRHSLHDMVGAEEEEVQKAFMKRTSLRANQRFEETRRYLEKYRENVDKGVAKRPPLGRRQVFRGIMAAVAVILAVVAWVLIDRDVNSVRAMSSSDLERLSPVLESGGISVGESRAFIGAVSSARWMLLSPEERHDAAESILSGLSRYQCHSAWITRDGRQAIQIEGGELVSVE